MTEYLTCNPNCIFFKILQTGWTSKGAPAVCIAKDSGIRSLGIIPFTLVERDSNLPDESFVQMLQCINPTLRTLKP